MENRIKERLTGALILVALLVILVPELLSGRAPHGSGEVVPEARPATEGPPLRSYTMDLAAAADASPAGQSALNVKPADDAATLPAPASAPIPPPEAAPAPAVAPAATAAPPPRPEAQPKPEQAQPAQTSKSPAAPAPKPQSAPVPAPTSASATGWYVQVGSFAKRENAQRFVQELGKKGHSAQLLGGGSLFRVRVGPVNDRAAAAALQSRLSADGFKGAIVGP